MKLRGDELGFVAVCSRGEYCVVFIWLHVQLGGEGGGSEKFQRSRLSAALLSCCCNLLTRCVGQLYAQTS